MSSPSSALSMDVRSVSPPAKLFHCAMSPRRRPPRTHHAPQRLQRPHRPCLDFDKMQQINTRSVTSWHNPEHTGELSVFVGDEQRARMAKGNCYGDIATQINQQHQQQDGLSNKN